ncbi:hypothetical protein BJX66DRAFT_305518 [Aspergillus keveii]|uniref:F-box domain-containing protein n=1 Tax=Aspergillus keveii TaxID=714993 RepID=A0ABR4G418_9EURO
MSFTSLPAEIVLLILDYVNSPATIRDFCLLSAKFRAIAQPLLYREITLNPEDLPLSPLLLCRTITISPLIASQVRSLEIDTEQSSDLNATEFTERRELSKHDTRLLKCEAQKLNLNSIKLFNSTFWATDSIILPLLLISRFPNLRELVINLDPAGLALLTSLAQARNADNTRQSLACLGSFRTLHLGCFRDLNGNGIEIENITLLLSFLRLSKIQISNYDSIPHDSIPYPTIDAAPDVLLGSLSVSTISLDRSSISTADMGTLVNSCKELDSLYYGQCDSQAIQLNPEQLYSQLLFQRDSLRVLQLSYEADSLGTGPSPAFTPPHFGSLLGLDHLESLTIDQIYLDAAPEFPPSLTRLSIQNCQTPIAGLLIYLANLASTGLFPNLKNVFLHSDDIYPGRMLDLPRRGATDVLFYEACRMLLGIFKGTEVTLRLNKDLLGITDRGYADAFEFGLPGVFWPFVYML